MKGQPNPKIAVLILAPGKKYPENGPSDMHKCFAIYFVNPCFRVLLP